MEAKCTLYGTEPSIILKKVATLSRHTYSGQKHIALVKFMSLVFPDGYVLDSIGPYLTDGKNNDAGITENILSLHADLTEWLSEGDVCVVDRGFRDILDVFEDLGLETKMPAYRKKGISCTPDRNCHTFCLGDKIASHPGVLTQAKKTRKTLK